MTQRVGLLFIVAALWCSPLASAQSVSFGGTLGANLSTATTSDDLSTGIRTTVMFGGVMRVDLPGPVAVQPELLFSERGITVSEGTGQVNYNASYLEVPLQLRLQLPSVWRLNLFATAGGSFGLKMFETQSIGGTLETQVNTNTSFYERTDMSGLVGFGASFEDGPSPIGVVVRYMHGFNDIARTIDEQPFQESGNVFPSSASLRTLTLGVYIGI
ncbi:MAG: porin family protein [Longimonas sp.]|uniref:porin family protein n=1 Tax=Longimonas sp. TaxID=2039626 RepID=UPI003344C668